MTVSTEISSNEYTGNGVTTDFDYKFRIFKANQLSVITSDADGDNVVTLRLGTDYTVTGANKSAGGKVILTKPLSNGHKISIARDIPITQETSFRNQSKFFAETHEDAFDYLTMIIQRIWGSLGSLYLKRPNILANWYDAKGYRIANLGKPKRDSDAIDFGTMKNAISSQSKRSLRVDDIDIAALPKASERAGNVLTFDQEGKPIVSAPASGSAIDVLNKLSKNTGSLLVGGSLIEFNSVNEASSTHGINEGRKVRTYKHNVDVVSEWIYTKQKPTGNEFYIDAIDGYLILLTPNFASAGVKSGDYLPESAWHNRNTIMRLMRDSRFNKFSFGGVGKFYILGSVIPNRNNITLEIEEGVEVVGRYDDPSIPESTEFQRGEMFGFPICSGYDAGNLDVTDDVNDITVIINGSASTEYSENHSRKNNNNVIGFIRSNNCVVKGNGGINSSDHKGICFDGDAVNCHIDLSYILNTKNEPFQMKGKFSAGIRNKCTSRVGRIETTFGGDNPRVVAFVSGCSHDVTIDKFDYYSESNLPVLVGAFGAHSVNIKLGEIGGASQLVRMYNTNKVRLSADVVSKTPSLVIRAGNELNIAHDVVIENIKAVDNALTSAYAEEAGIQGATRFVTINNCDFFPASTSFKYLATVINPTSKSIYNNTSRPGMNIVEYNPIIGRQSRNVITAGTRIFVYDAALPDFNYSSINLLVRNSSGATYSLDVNIKARLDSGVSGATFSIGGVIVDTVLSGLKMTISTTTEGASFLACTPFN